MLLSKTFLLFLILLFLGNTSFGQLFQTRSDIIKDKGYGYKTGVADDGTKYIYYEKQMRTSASGSYTMTKVMYFITLDNGKEICYKWKILEPSSETNSNVAHFKNKFVEIGYMRWKDYENEVVYDIEVKDGICIISAWWDNEK